MLNAPAGELLTAIVDGSDDAIISKTLTGTITSWNRAAERLFGYTAVEAIGQPITMLFPPDRLGEEARLLGEIASGRRVNRFETERVRKNGERVLVTVSLSPVRDRDGHVIGASKIARDVGERVRLEHTAARTAADLDRVLASIGEGFAVLDRDLRYVFANDVAERLVGIPRNHALGRTPWDLFPPEVTDVALPRVRDALERGVSATYETYYPSADRWFENRVYPWADGVSVFFTDITDRKRSEHSLRQSRDMLALAMRGGRMGAWARDLATNSVWWSRELEEIVGLGPGGFEGTEAGFFAFVHDDDRERVEGAVRSAIATGDDYVVEFRFRHASGDWRWMEGRGRAVYEADGRPVSLHGIGIDITDRKISERALAAARDAANSDAQRLSLALAAARLGDWVWDRRTDRVTCSPRAAEIFGIPEGATPTWAEMRGWLHPDDRPRVDALVMRAIGEDSEYAAEFRLINRHRERWVSSSGRARHNEQGEVTGLLGVVQDTTQERLLIRIDDAVRALSDAEHITDTATRLLGQHLHVNRCSYASVGRDENSFVLIGDYTDGTVERDTFDQLGAEGLRIVRGGEPYVVEDSRRDPRLTAAERRSCERAAIAAVACVPILRGDRLVAAMAVETTAPRTWRADEIEFIQQVAGRCWESIERARGERERAELLQNAEAANRAKDEFMAMLGHELRNPLSPILTALQLMTLRGITGAERERVVIERQVRHLTRLVDDLLDVSRIARGKVELKTEVIELGAIVASAIEVASPLLEERTHTLTVDVPRRGLPIEADAARLTQVVSNLLTNAAKYTPPGGRVWVSAAPEGAEVLLRVRDNGIGIAPDVQPRIFDLFMQGRQPLDRAQGGLGLGLTIVRSLVERHGGRVHVSSEGSGRGSEFAIRLPLAVTAPVTADQPAADHEVVSAGIEHAPRILIVDDNEDAAEMLEDVLRSKGYRTHVAHDGPGALAAAAALRPDVALLDIGLPVMDGYELASRLRELPGLHGIRLVAVTGYGQSSDRKRSAAAGFSHHLVKPVDLALLDAILGLAAN
jgi:PAS domain S-box-containing protein